MAVNLKVNGSVGTYKLIRDGTVGSYGLSACCCATCDCDDGLCCWSSDSKIAGTLSITDVIYHNTVGGDLSDSHDLVPPNCTGTTQSETDGSGNVGDVTSDKVWTLTIDWTFTAIPTGIVGSDCCWFLAGGERDDGTCGGFDNPPFQSPGLTITLKDSMGADVSNVKIEVAVLFAHNCNCSGGQWNAYATWTMWCPDEGSIQTDCINGCFDGTCDSIDDITCNGCIRGPDFLSHGHYSSIDSSLSITGITVTTHCCRDGEGNCVPGATDLNGDCGVGVAPAKIIAAAKAPADGIVPKIQKPCSGCKRSKGTV